MRFDKRTATIALASLMIIGGASAGVVNYFATSTGTGTVSEAITVTGNDAITFDSGSEDVYAPETYQEQLTLVNNNEDDEVTYTWQTEEYTLDDEDNTEGNGELSYVNSGVYEVQNYTTEAEFEDVTEDVTVEVTPSVDTVTYEVYLPRAFEDSQNADQLFDLEIANGDESDYHIKFSRDKGFDSGEFGENFGAKIYNTSENSFGDVVALSEVDDVRSAEVEDLSGDGEVVTVVVDNPSQNQQRFGLKGDYQSGSYTTSAPFRITEDFSYGDTSTYTEPVDENIVGQEVALTGGTSQTYNFVTEFTEQTGEDDYEVTAQAVP